MYGYIWVSCESWGYMPYMFGSWNYYGGFGWGWSPGYNPWWSSGGWSSNVVATSKIHYQPPSRPRGGPIKPRDVSVFPSQPTHQPHRIVVVDRMKNADGAKPIRPQGAPLMVAGKTVEPMRPVAIKQRASFSEFNNNRRTSAVVSRAGGGQYNGFVQAPPKMMPARPVFTGSTGTGSSFVHQTSGGSLNMPRPAAPHYSMPRPPESSVVNRAPSVSMPSYRPQGSPSMGAPRISAPSMSAPRMSAPHMSAPAPRMSAPSMSMPRMSAPAMSAPHVSSGGGSPHK
jgi:hypothetical protein